MSSDKIENVLILQGGGSLGAFGCGVLKALANHNIKIDIVAGTSIGGLNATIIAGSKGDHPERETLASAVGACGRKQCELKVPCLSHINNRPLYTHTYFASRIDIFFLWFSISRK